MNKISGYVTQARHLTFSGSPMDYSHYLYERCVALCQSNILDQERIVICENKSDSITIHGNNIYTMLLKCGWWNNQQINILDFSFQIYYEQISYNQVIFPPCVVMPGYFYPCVPSQI